MPPRARPGLRQDDRLAAAVAELHHRQEEENSAALRNVAACASQLLIGFAEHAAVLGSLLSLSSLLSSTCDVLAMAAVSADRLLDPWCKPSLPVNVDWLMVGPAAEDGATLAAVVTLHTLCIYDTAQQGGLAPRGMGRLQDSTWRLIHAVLERAEISWRRGEQPTGSTVEPRARRLGRAAARGLLRFGLLDTLPRTLIALAAIVRHNLEANVPDLAAPAGMHLLLLAGREALALVEGLCKAATAGSVGLRDELLTGLGHSQVRQGILLLCVAVRWGQGTNSCSSLCVSFTANGLAGCMRFHASRGSWLAPFGGEAALANALCAAVLFPLAGHNRPAPGARARGTGAAHGGAGAQPAVRSGRRHAWTRRGNAHQHRRRVA